MKKIVILIFTFLMWNLSVVFTEKSLYAQPNEKTKPVRDFRRVQLGINLSPDVCYRTLKNMDGDEETDLNISSHNSIEIPKISFTGGVNVGLHFTRFFGIETGIHYSDKGYQTKILNMTPPPGGGIDPTAYEKVRYNYHFHYIDIPLKFFFTVGKRKVRFLISGGIITNVFIKETQTISKFYMNYIETETTDTEFDYKRINLSPMLGLGIDYRITQRMNLRIEPVFRYGILKIIDAPITGYLYNVGLNIGYYVGF
ncbi:MAG: PorT family protein [Flavobacteriales bacterium]|nr:PorT family protein [Flavobacteriales bacterium]